MSLKKVLITGVSGQAGSYFVDYLLKNTNHQIYGMVRRLSVTNHKNIDHLKNEPRFWLFSGDLNDEHSIYSAIETIKPDYFINAAAMSFVAESWISPANTFKVDAVAIIHILEAIRKFVPNCRFVNYGSSEEFGDVIYSPQDEKHPARARSVYGAAKIAARQIIKVYRESYGLYAVQPWNFNYESKRRGEEFVTRKITKGVARIKNTIEENQFRVIDQPFEPISLGGYDSVRDWSHAEDIVDGVWRMLNQDIYREDFPSIDCGNRIPYLREYVFSSNECHSVREFVEKAFEAANLEGFWEGEGKNEIFRVKVSYDFYEPAVKISEKFYRPADVTKLWGDSSLAKKELCWQPKWKFIDLVKEMVENDLKTV